MARDLAFIIIPKKLRVAPAEMISNNDVTISRMKITEITKRILCMVSLPENKAIAWT